MITKTPEAGSVYNSKYSELFAEINAASAAANGNLNITDLADYFGNITEIKSLKDGKFLILPLEEEKFEIDADSRKITVPDHFKSNGLSVQGDHLAETVFFRINRYFDYVDLNNYNIRINWKMGDEQKSSINFLKNKDIDPGYIIFGWSIGKELTQKSGSLTFAVQFFEKNQDGSYKYNFNTLPATINIKDGLILTDPEVVNNSSDILNMLVNSSFGVGEVAVGDAVWDQQPSVDGTFASIVNLDVNLANNKAPAAVAKTLVGKASAVNASQIEYSGSSVITDASKLAGISGYSENDGKVYMELAGVGNYSAIAQGAKFNSSNQRIGSGDAKESSVVTVPAPKKPAVSMEVTMSKAMSESAYDLPQAGNYAYLKGATGATLKATVGLSEGMVEDDFGAWEFKWFKDNVLISDEADIKFINNKKDNSKTVHDEGAYKVEVRHFKNGQIADKVTSEVFNINNAPSDVGTVSVVYGANSASLNVTEGEAIPSAGVSFESQGSLSKHSIKVKASIAALAEGAYSDENGISYSWIKAPAVDSENWVSAGEGQELSISSEGWYKAVVKNNYKGCASIAYSAPFHADDVSNNQ